MTLAQGPMQALTSPITERLVDAEGLLAALFDPQTRPSLKWLHRQRKRKLIPFFRLGRYIRFDPVLVRQALDRDCLVTARNSTAGGVR